jgi:hypothetical protein
MYEVISVPFGMVMSFPCTRRKRGAAGKNIMLVGRIFDVSSQDGVRVFSQRRISSSSHQQAKGWELIA